MSVLGEFVESDYLALASWRDVLIGISIYVIADAGMVAQFVLEQFQRILWRFGLDYGNARSVEVGGNASVFDCVSFHRFVFVFIGLPVLGIHAPEPVRQPHIPFGFRLREFCCQS